MYKNIYLVRHCSAEGQAPDSDLTSLGKSQAETLTEFLLDKQIDSIITSPFKRAIESIKPLADRLGLQVKIDNRLSERILSSTIHEEWLKMLEHSFQDLDICYEGGESSRLAMKRAIEVVEDVLKSSSNNIIITTHGNLMSLILKYYDKSFGFNEWNALTNPDVFCLKFNNALPQINRVWNESMLLSN